MTFKGRRESNRLINKQQVDNDNNLNNAMKSKRNVAESEGYYVRNNKRVGKISDNSDESTISNSVNKKVVNQKVSRSKNSNAPDNKNIISAVSLLLEELSLKDLNILKNVIERKIDLAGVYDNYGYNDHDDY
jgi:hypothetical protein